MSVCKHPWLVAPALIASSASLGGCTSIEGFPRRPETIQVVEDKRSLFFGPSAENAYYAASTEADRRRERDRLVYGKMEVIEYDFEALERALNGTGNSVSLFGDLSVLALTGIASTTGGEATKSALAAMSSGIVGAQGAVSKNLYFQRTLPALLTQMEANRIAVRATIIAALVEKSDADYPLPAAAIDLRRLIRAGSIPASVAGITQQAAAQRDESQAKVDGLRNLSFSSSDSSKTLSAWLNPGGVRDAGRAGALQQWLNARPETFLRIPLEMFVRGEDPRLEPIRQLALQDASLAIMQ